MRPAAILIVLVLAPTTCLAQETSPADAFRALASLIPVRPSVTGQWFDALPEIARRCNLDLDRQRVATLVGSFGDADEVDEEADAYADRSDNKVRAAWEAVATGDRESACRLVQELWGRNGSQFPDILRSRPADDVAASPPMDP